jgi:hypothetical protein
MNARPLRAPTNDGGLLIEPAPGAVAGLVHANRLRWDGWDYDFQGRPFSRLRAGVRREVLQRADAFLLRHGIGAPPRPADAGDEHAMPLIVTGHQPELFHPGVWIKNFAAGAVAAACSGLGLNLIIDSDFPKTSSIQVPRLAGGGLELERVEFDRWGGDTPYEELQVQDEAILSRFPERVRWLLEGLVPDPVLEEFWPKVLARRDQASTLAMRFSLARRELEAAWGTQNLELPQSAVCQTEGFLWFACHVLAQLTRYQEIHNRALVEYRRAHRIRSNNHPVPALSRQGDWLEAPFWAWRAQEPRRRGLLARRRGRALELRIAGEDAAFLELPLAPDSSACCAVERLRELSTGPIRIRTRALTTTMFSRILLADLFIHGIGGAKYEELGDEISRRFFGFDPPGFLTLSMTRWMGLPIEPSSALDLASIKRRSRELRFNPDRFLREPYAEEIRNLIRAKYRFIAGPVSTRQERLARCRAIRRCNDALQSSVRELEAELLQLQASTVQRIRSNRTARNRAFAFLLHSAQRLRDDLVRKVQETWPSRRSGCST